MITPIIVTLPKIGSSRANRCIEIRRIDDRPVIIQPADGDVIDMRTSYESYNKFTTLTRVRRKWFQFWKPELYWRESK